mgnify:CR=1 FL=1
MKQLKIPVYILIAAKHLLVVRCLARHQERLKMASSLHQVRFALCLIPRCGKNDSFDCATSKSVFPSTLIPSWCRDSLIARWEE